MIWTTQVVTGDREKDENNLYIGIGAYRPKLTLVLFLTCISCAGGLSIIPDSICRIALLAL